MAVFKCKMCGGALEVNNETVATCSYCGTQQTLPKLDDEKKAQLYDRANYFRRENEFDKAMGIYEMILSDEKTDSEAYWGIVLCRYGIEYVEDPRSHKRIPTVNRAQFTSIFDDEDYKKAVTYADSMQKGIYEAEATVIDKIQKGILALSSKEEPFDVFICYKETDNQGNRTQDSVYAQDIYNALVKEGYKVFFSRITLEDKLGSAYEPYIFAALQSAKVMLVVGTTKDNFNAVWVKNEWSRFISLIKAGREKTLIPLYKDMSPYEMPEEFQYLQSQDMGKIGYIQDVVHGITKVIPLESKVETNTTVENQVAESMLKKAMNFIASGDYKSALLCLDTVHAYEPDNAMYYVGNLMIQYKCTRIEALAELDVPITSSDWYKCAVEHAGSEMCRRLKSYGSHSVYNAVSKILQDEKSIIKLQEALENLAEVDCDDPLVSDVELVERIKVLKESIKAQIAEIENEEKAEAELKEKLQQERERKRKKRKKIIIGIMLSILSGFVLLAVYNFVINPISIMAKADEAFEDGDYEAALSYYASVKGYGDASDKIFEIEQMLLEDAQVGDVVCFGVYKADEKVFGYQFAPIEWIVLERDGDELTLISKKCLAAVPYHSSLSDVYWDGTSLYDWLNDSFKNNAFSYKEKNCLLSACDILDEQQLETYFPYEEDRRARGTNYAKGNGLQVGENGYSCWWIKNADETLSAAPVLSTGAIGEPLYITNEFVGVRPVIKIKLPS